ncbi:MAG: hypothetical protein EA356_09405 [Geminicoccaceae bacterium]|nr:MAG: hypothetical protein EA356_09405 [Geminicoccaceae bacterium]
MRATPMRLDQRYLAPVLVRAFGVRLSLDASWLPLGILLYATLDQWVMPALAPALDDRTYRMMALLGTLGLVVGLVVVELAVLAAAARSARRVELRVTPLGGVVLADPATDVWALAPRLRDELSFLVARLVAGALVGAVPLLAWFWFATAATPPWLGGVLLFLGPALWVVVAVSLLPVWPWAGGRILRALIRRWTGPTRSARHDVFVVALILALAAALAGFWLTWHEVLAVGSWLVGAGVLFAYLACLGHCNGAG